jgi:hypothetical protein
MAFNPFHSMRKNSKAILAVVTIFIMIIFVLGSGLRGGDFFNDLLPRWLGGGRSSKGAALATMYGEEVRRAELDGIQSQRILANEFMVRAMESANHSLMSDVYNKIQAKQISEDTGRILQPIVRSKVDANDPKLSDAERNAAGMQYINLLQGVLMELRGQSNQFQRSLLQMLRMTLARIDPKDQKAEADRHALTAVENVLVYEALHLTERRAPRHFMVFDQASPLRDALTFKLFLAKADKMGIQFPDSVVNELIVRETYNHLSQADAGAIESYLKKNRSPNLTTDHLMKAIGDEFRVRTVVDMLLGRGSANHTPGYLTPYEFYQFYKDNLSDVTFNMIRVPVQDFVAKVKEEPTDAELKELFNKYRLQEADPARDTPGFKLPRKVKLEWVSGSPSLPIYAQNAPVIQAVSQVAAGAVPTLPGAGGIPAIAHVAQPQLAENLPLWAKYRDKLASQTGRAFWSWFMQNLQDTSIYRPLPIAALAGQLAGLANPLKDIQARMTFEHFTHASEMRDRARVGVPLMLAPLSLTPAFPLAGFGPALAALPAPLPQVAYAGQFTEELRAERLMNLFRNDMKNFQDQMRKIRTAKGPDNKERKAEAIKPEVEKFVAEFVKVRGMQHGASQEPRDKYTIADDPGLKALREKAPPPKPWEQREDEWDDAFFSAPRFIPGLGTLPERDLFEANWFPGFGPSPGEKDPSFLVWKTDDTPAKVILKWDDAPAEVKEKVKAAWKFEKARALAKAEAERLAEKARAIAKKQLGEADNVNGFRGELFDMARPFNSFDLGPMSVLRFDHGGPDPSTPLRPDRRPGYEEYRLKPSEDIPYPGPIPGELLNARNEPLGKTLVVSDQPKASYYVASLVKKNEKDVDDFGQVFKRTANPVSQLRDTLYLIAEQSKALPEAQRDIIERLKAEARYSENEEELKKSDKDRGDEA